MRLNGKKTMESSSVRLWSSIFANLILLSLICLIFPPLILAQAEVKELPGNIRLGPLRIHPTFHTKQEYTDNVFLEYRNPADDYIATMSPGLILQLPFGPAKEEAGVRKSRHMVQAQYRSDIMEYTRHEWVSFVEHLVGSLLNLDFPGGLGFNIDHKYHITSIPPYSPTEERKKFTELNTASTLSYRFADRYKAEVGYIHNVIRFKKTLPLTYFDGRVLRTVQESDSRTKDEGVATLYYRILPKTSVLIEYGYYLINNKDLVGISTDNKNHRLWVGLTWEPGGKITGTLKGGYIAIRFIEEGGGKDSDDFGVKCELTYDLSPYNHFTLIGRREILQTYVSTKTSPVYGSIYVLSGINLAFRHDFTPKISASVDTLYQNLDFREKAEGHPDPKYRDKQRQDHNYGGGVSADYQIQDWLLCGLKYSYIYNDSNIPYEKYKENKIMFRISVVF